MTNTDFILVTLFPLVFMFHDFEEIIFMKSWLVKNSDYLQNRFPSWSKQILKMNGISTSAFALGVAEEFILFCMGTYASLLTGNYGWWFGLLAGFTLHIIIHILQFIIVGRYVPVIVTSILVLPYCIYTLVRFCNLQILSMQQMIFYTLIMSAIMALNLLFVHKLMPKLKL
jgi:hypothetical protein